MKMKKNHNKSKILNFEKQTNKQKNNNKQAKKKKQQSEDMVDRYKCSYHQNFVWIHLTVSGEMISTDDGRTTTDAHMTTVALLCSSTK